MTGRNFLRLILTVFFILTLSLGLSACAEEGKKKIKFFTATGGSTVYHFIETDGYESIVLPDDPKKEGYTFDGWYFDVNNWKDRLTEDYYIEKSLERDTPVYAKWLKNEYDIIFYTEFGIEEVFAIIQTAGNAAVLLPDPPVKEGYAFAGWFFEYGVWIRQLTENYYENITLTANKTVYAKWLKTYDLAFYDDSEIYGITRTAGNEILTLSAPEKDGYVFKGWYFDKGVWKDQLTADYYESVILTTDKSVYAKWLKKYDVTFYDDDEIYEIIDTAGGEILILPTPEKEGYAFKGWYFDKEIWEDELTADYFESVILIADVSVHAKWEEILD